MDGNVRSVFGVDQKLIGREFLSLTTNDLGPEDHRGDCMGSANAGAQILQLGSAIFREAAVFATAELEILVVMLRRSIVYDALGGC